MKAAQRIMLKHFKSIVDILDGEDLSSDKESFEDFLREFSALIAVSRNTVCEGINLHHEISFPVWRLLFRLSEPAEGWKQFEQSFCNSLGVSMETDRDELRSLRKLLDERLDAENRFGRLVKKYEKEYKTNYE